MKFKVSILIVVFLAVMQNTKANSVNYSYPDKYKSYDLSTLGAFGKHLLHVDSLIYLNMDSTFKYIEKAQYAMNPESDLEKVLYYYYKNRVDRASASFNKESHKMLRLGLDLSEKNQFYYYTLKFHKIYAEEAYPDWDVVFDHLLKALDLAKKMDNNQEVLMVLMNMTMHLETLGEIEEARAYLEEIRMYMDPEKTHFSNYIRYYKIASNLEDSLEPANLYLDTAIHIAKTNQSHLFHAKLYAERAFLFRKHDQVEKAIQALDKSDEILSENNLDYLIGEYTFIRAKFYVDNNEGEKAKMYFEKFLKSDGEKDGVALNLWGYLVYAAAKDSATALRYYLKHVEEVMGDEQAREDSLFVEFQHKHKVEQMKMDNMLKTERLKHYKFQNRMIMVVALLFLFVLSYVYYIRNRKKAYQLQATKQILEKEQELHAFRMRFMENMTHEIRTPLTILQGIFDFLQTKLSDSEFSHLLEIGFKNSEQLKFDIEQILHSIAVEPYSGDVQLTPTNLYLFFAELIEQYKLKAFSKGVFIEFTHNLSDFTNTEMDTDKWATIFRNYFTNAVKYSYQGERIIIKVEADKEIVTLSIKNYGSVIEKNDQLHVFNRYYQVKHQEELEPEEGFGIGLSIVKELAGIMSAEIGVSSDEEEQSTVFYCRMNLKVKQIASHFKTEYFNIPEENLYTKLSGITKEKPNILVVDDNELMIRFYKQILTHGFNCDFASNGAQALEELKEKTYDCIVTDVMMPEVDGFKLVETINGEKNSGMTPVIFVTANYIEEAKIDAFRIGVHDFITKPFVVKELIVRIHNVIRNNENRIVQEEDENIIPSYDISSEQLNDDKQLLDKIIANIDDNLSDPDFSIATLAENVFYSSRQLTRKTKLLTGLTPSKLIMERRLMKAEYILKTSINIRISEVQKLIGINSTAYFNRAFKERFGVTPRDLKRKNKAS